MCPTDFEGPNCDIPAQEYGYSTDNDSCDVKVINTNGGGDIVEHEDNVVIKFWVFGDFPYDEEATAGNQRACCQEGGGLVTGCIPDQGACDAQDCGEEPAQTDDACIYDSIRFKCAPGCVFEGQEYECWRNTIIPWMNMAAQDSVESFAFFTGDSIKGERDGNSGFCNPDVLTSRQALFNTMNVDVIHSVGDNDWNECNGFNENPTDNANNVIRKMHRDFFQTLTSFSRNFPGQLVSGYQAKPPTIYRDSNYPELFYFLHNDVVFIGVTAPDRWAPPANTNENWIRNSLANIASDYPTRFSNEAAVCNGIQSVVILSHTSYFSTARTQIDEFFGGGGGSTGCGRGNGDVPLLNTRGDEHIYSYCDESNNNFELINGGDFTPESSDPHSVTILRDPRTLKHYFRVDRNNGISDTCNGFN